MKGWPMSLKDSLTVRLHLYNQMAPLGVELSCIATPSWQSGNNEMALVPIGQQAFIIFNTDPVPPSMHHQPEMRQTQYYTQNKIFIRKEIRVVDKFEPCKLTLSPHSSWEFHCTGSAWAKLGIQRGDRLGGVLCYRHVQKEYSAVPL